MGEGRSKNLEVKGQILLLFLAGNIGVGEGERGHTAYTPTSDFQVSPPLLYIFWGYVTIFFTIFFQYLHDILQVTYVQIFFVLLKGYFLNLLET